MIKTLNAPAASSSENVQAPPPQDSWSNHYMFGIIAILLLSALSYVALSAAWPKFSRAEVFFAECAREMLRADALVTPLYHDRPFFDKPILTYWLIATSFLSFGTNHLAARIPSIAAALCTVFLTAFGARKIYGNQTALWAGMILASSFMFMSFAALCMSDMLLVLCDTAALFCLFWATTSQRYRTLLFAVSGLLLGLGFNVKGPVGIVLPAFSYLAYLGLTKQWRLLSFMNVAPATMITILAASPWFMAAYRENGASALIWFFVRENIQRFAGSTYDTHKPLWHMLVSLFTGMLPWSVFLFPAARMSWQKWQRDFSSPESRTELYLWLWIGVVIGFFSLSRGKIDYYALPAYPAAAILVGRYLSGISSSSWLPRCSALTIGFVLLALAVISTIFAFVQAEPGLPAILATTGTALCLGIPAIAALVFSSKDRIKQALICYFLSACLTATWSALLLYPWLNNHQAVLHYIPTIKNCQADQTICVYSSLANWIDEITFQTDAEPISITSPAMAAHMLKQPVPTLLLIPADSFATLPAAIRQRSRIVASKPFISHAITPGFLWKKRGNIADGPKLLLISNH